MAPSGKVADKEEEGRRAAFVLFAIFFVLLCVGLVGYLLGTMEDAEYFATRDYSILPLPDRMKPDGYMYMQICQSDRWCQAPFLIPPIDSRILTQEMCIEHQPVRSTRKFQLQIRYIEVDTAEEAEVIWQSFPNARKIETLQLRGEKRCRHY